MIGMIKSLKRINISALFVFLLNAGLMLAVVFLYMYGDPEFVKNYLTTVNILIISGSLIVFTLFFNWLSIFVIHRNRQKNELLAAEVIGNDIKEAYNYGMIGLVVVDADQRVIWQSEFITSRGLNLLDKKITDWQRPLLRLVNVSEGDVRDPDGEYVNVEHNDRTYQVKYISEAGLFVFKDITENIYLYKKIEQRSPVVGICMIDNYTDTSASREMGNPLLSMVTSAIFEYGKEHGFLVRKYRDDAFLFVGDYQHFEDLLNDKFSIVEKIHNMEVDQERPFTVSVGFAYNFPDAVKLNEMAVNAIDLAMSRGGDQVVVSKYGEEHQYFGGTSVASAKQNKVKVRLTADTFVSVTRNASNVIIMGHTNADLDAIGAALGAKAICDYILKKEAERMARPYKPCLIVYESKSVESKTKLAVKESFSRSESEETFVHPRDVHQHITPSTLLLVVDVSRPNMLMSPELLEDFTKVAVIDHHRRAEDFLTDPVFQYIEPSASSTSELITELAEYGNFPGISFPAKYSTIMLAGIYLDTNYFRSNTTGTRTFEAAMILKDHGADNTLADEFLKDQYEEHALINKILSTMETIELGVVIAKSDPKDLIEPATLAKVANQCLQIKDVKAAFVVGNLTPNDTQVSARSDGTINVQILMERLGGGGHQAAAAGKFVNQSSEEVVEKIKDTVARYLSSARVSENKK